MELGHRDRRGETAERFTDRVTRTLGHESGRRGVEIRRKNVAELSESDYDRMRKVVGYDNRHTPQRPDGDMEETDSRYSPMNWGHDPLM